MIIYNNINHIYIKYNLLINYITSITQKIIINKLNKQMERISALKNSLSGPVYKQSPLKVTVTGAAGNIGYALVFMIG